MGKTWPLGLQLWHDMALMLLSNRWEAETSTGSEAVLEPSSLDPQAPHSPSRNYVLKILQLPWAALLASDHVFKHKCLWGTIHICTTTHGFGQGCYEGKTTYTERHVEWARTLECGVSVFATLQGNLESPSLGLLIRAWWRQDWKYHAALLCPDQCTFYERYLI